MESTFLDWTGFFSKYLKPQIVFLVLALTAGLAMVFVNAPFQVPDEGAHFWRAYHVSQGDWTSSRKGDVVGGEIPKSVAAIIQKYDYLIGHPEMRVDRDAFGADLNRPFEGNTIIFKDFFTQALYAPTVYLPQAIGIALGRLCGLSALKMMYAGRISALLCWIAIIFMAIRIVPIYKWVFVLIALIPRSLSLAASLSADGPTNAMALLLTAVLMREIFGKEAGLKTMDAILILLLSLLLSMAKQVYLPLVGLVLLIPAEKFNGMQKKLFFCGLVLGAAVLATALWSMTIRDFYRPWNDANAPEQMALILARPWIFPVIAVNSFLEHWRSMFFSFIGVLGFLDVWLPKWIYRSYPFILLGMALFDAGCGKPIRWFQRGWILVLLICSFMLIELSMYLVWTKPGADLVNGVHGRYFIALAIPALLALFYNQRLKLPMRRLMPLALGLYLCAVLAASCWSVYVRYYGPAL
ncbi:MAG: DUF2142 domain-containing protein [Planctomycetota bacterium]|jgi:uncharacterized membrane protein